MVYLAKDSDFKNVKGLWIYKGDSPEVEIPEYINGELVTSAKSMFNQSYTTMAVNKVVLKHNHVTNMDSMFFLRRNLISLDLSSFDTSNVTDMNYMFYDCRSLPNLDLSSFDTSNVTDMSHMFRGCRDLTSLDLSSFDTSNVTDMSHMFSGCSNLTTLDLSSFDTSNVTDMSYMFSGVNNLKEVYTRTKEDAERLKSRAQLDGRYPKFYYKGKEKIDFEANFGKLALGDYEIGNIYFKDKDGNLNELMIFKDGFAELQ